jgi:hypothetical protein
MVTERTGKSSRTVYMRFEQCQGWRISFFDRANPTARFRELTFADKEKIEDMVAKTSTKMVLADRQAFESGLQGGRGVIQIDLNDDQYSKLIAR